MIMYEYVSQFTNSTIAINKYVIRIMQCNDRVGSINELKYGRQVHLTTLLSACDIIRDLLQFPLKVP